MKFNKWTLGLAAVGVVSFASVAQAAEERGLDAVSAWTKGVTISGYVDTSVDLTLSPHEQGLTGTGAFQGGESQFDGDASFKRDGFNLNVVKLTIEKAPGQEDWASGFKVDLLYGPDAVNFNSSANAVGGQSAQHFTGENGADFAIKQAYVALRTPVGNGIDWKIGVFNEIIGYETFESGNNPNFTRSIAWANEPTEHTGILASYRVCDSFAISAGVANTLMAGINARNLNSTTAGATTDWQKTGMASIALTAPQDWGWAAGSTLSGGVVYGFNGGSSASAKEQANYYVGGSLKTPVAGVTVGGAFDYISHTGGAASGKDRYALAGYASWQANDKMSLNGRFEYAHAAATVIYSTTGTLQYNLWANVISRLELRWDRNTSGAFKAPYADGGSFDNIVSLYANIIYQF